MQNPTYNCRLFQHLKIKTAALVMASYVAIGTVQAENDTLYFDIRAEQLGKALKEFAIQTNKEILFSTKMVKGKLSSGLYGKYTEIAALEAILSGTDLRAEQTKNNVYLIIAETGRPQTVNTNLKAKENSNKDKPIDKTNQEFKGSERKPPMEEIMVTATKRLQDLQNTSLSISVLGSEEIKRKTLVNMTDYLRTTPGINQIDQGAGQNAIVIRGVTADPINESFSTGPTVGIYLGETPITGYALGNSADIKLIDMERVEVIRGPQGTLYGSSSLSGTVRNIPVAPNLQDFEFSIEGGYASIKGSNDNNFTSNGIINLPIIQDRLAIRAVLYQFDNAGYIDNIAGDDPEISAISAAFGVSELAVNQKDIGGSEYNGGRITTLWEPSDRLKLSYTYVSQDVTQDERPFVQTQFGRYQQSRRQFGATVGNDKALEVKVDINNLVIGYDLGWAELISASSWIDQSFTRKWDIASFLPGNIPGPQISETNAEVFIQEVRLASISDKGTQYTLGIYYEDSEQPTNQDTFYGGDIAFNPFGNETLLQDVFLDNQVKQKAIFGEFYYSVTDKITATLGARFFDYNRTLVQNTGGALFGGIETMNSVQNNEDGSIFKVGLDYQASDNTLIYGQWSEGFRLGKPVAQLPPSCDADSDGFYDGTNISTSTDSVDSDNLESIELGVKTDLLQGRLTINSSIYRNKWKNIPITIRAECLAGIDVNAAEATTQGFEIESTLDINSNLSIKLGTSYTDSELSKNTEFGAKGERLPGSPKYNTTLGVNYNFFMMGTDAYIEGDYSYVGGFYNSLDEEGIEAGKYHQLNISAGLIFENLSLQLFGKNLTDSDEFIWIDNVFPDNRAHRLLPRTFGFSIGYSL